MTVQETKQNTELATSQSKGWENQGYKLVCTTTATQKMENACQGSAATECFYF